MIRFIKKFFSLKEKSTDTDFFNRLSELEEKYSAMLLDVKKLEEDNIETNNILYELMNSIDALDTRIDIVTAEKFLKDSDDV